MSLIILCKICCRKLVIREVFGSFNSFFRKNKWHKNFLSTYAASISWAFIMSRILLCLFCKRMLDLLFRSTTLIIHLAQVTAFISLVSTPQVCNWSCVSSVVSDTSSAERANMQMSCLNAEPWRGAWKRSQFTTAQQRTTVTERTGFIMIIRDHETW